MGQKTSPIGFRTGITRGWESTWFASKQEYGTFLVEDQKIRKFIDTKYNKQMPKGEVAKTEIVRTRNEVTVTLHSARPGVVIGPRGGEVDKLREELEALTSRKVAVNVVEIKEPDLNAFLVGDLVAEQLVKRAAFRRAMKQACEAAMNAGAKGIKIMCSGRLAGAEIARREMQKMGSIPLHTLEADVDYAQARAETTYGTIGIKVWIYKGKFGEVLEARQQRRRRPFRREDGSGGEGSGERRGHQRQGRGPSAARPAVPGATPEQPQAEPTQQENKQEG
jgi:small subunit ribosomal protein S3